MLQRMGKKIAETGFPLPEEASFDEIVDVRSPGEFAEDHVTGAVNLPVLDDEERARVGTVYQQASPFEARRIGAAIVSRNIAGHLETHFSGKPRDYRPLVYCWRGGQRSGSLATVLAAVGWQVAVVEGGYRTYRQHVREFIESRSASLDFVVLNGYTGAGKTLVLKSLDASGEQVLELEGLARHKGSVFGGDPENPQPAQKRFESLIFDRLKEFTSSRPVFVEAESAKIGALNLPNPLWQRMKGAPVIEIVSPLEARAAYLTDDYREWLADPDRIARTLDRLEEFHSRATLTAWKTLADRGEWFELVSALLAEHYDKRYSVKGSGRFQAPAFAVELARHDDDSVAKCAAEVLAAAGDLVSGAPQPTGR